MKKAIASSCLLLGAMAVPAMPAIAQSLPPGIVKEMTANGSIERYENLPAELQPVFQDLPPGIIKEILANEGSIDRLLAFSDVIQDLSPGLIKELALDEDLPVSP